MPNSPACKAPSLAQGWISPRAQESARFTWCALELSLCARRVSPKPEAPRMASPVSAKASEAAPDSEIRGRVGRLARALREDRIR